MLGQLRAFSTAWSVGLGLVGFAFVAATCVNAPEGDCERDDQCGKEEGCVVGRCSALTDASAGPEESDYTACTDLAPGTMLTNDKGGRVITNAAVYPIYWNSNVRWQTELTSFYEWLTTSKYIEVLAQYGVGPARFVYPTVRPTAYENGLVTDLEIRSAIANLIATGKVHHDVDSLYMVHLPPGIQVRAADNSRSCKDFCGYHSAFHGTDGVEVYYGVLPDLGGECRGRCGTESDFDNGTSVAGHELVEAITDPAGNSWRAGLCENADMCYTTQVRLGEHVVQAQFSNSFRGCVPAVRVEKPAPYALWRQNDAYPLKWVSEGFDGPIRLLATRAGVEVLPIVNNSAPLSGEQSVTVPSDWKPGDGYSICAASSTYPNVFNCANPVAIEPPAVCATGASQSCGSNVGACKPGIQYCTDGVWGQCVGGITPVPEVCGDALDNDCDGQADEECSSGTYTVEFWPDSTVKTILAVHAFASNFTWTDLPCSPSADHTSCVLPGAPGAKLQVSADVTLTDNSIGWSCVAAAPCDYKLRGTVKLIPPTGTAIALGTAWNTSTPSHCWACNASLGWAPDCDSTKASCDAN